MALHHPDFDPSLKPKHAGDGHTLVAMRTDHGSALPQHGLAVHPHSNRDIALEADTLDHYLDIVRGAAAIVTDRLHVVVAAVMTGTRVTFVDPNDQKISRYVSFTFRDQADHLVQQVSFEALREQGFVVPAGAS
jgi:exopolysaccharide biosynthesis predicted pyruvyltransferase EpsI